MCLFIYNIVIVKDTTQKYLGTFNFEIMDAFLILYN